MTAELPAPHSYTKGSPRVSSSLHPYFLFGPISSWFPPRSSCPLSKWKPCDRVGPIFRTGPQGVFAARVTGYIQNWFFAHLPSPSSSSYCTLYPEPEFLNVYGAQESILTAYEARRAGAITLFLLGCYPP